MFPVQIFKIFWWNHFLFVWLRAAHSIVCLVISIIRFHVSGPLYFFLNFVVIWKHRTYLALLGFLQLLRSFSFFYQTYFRGMLICYPPVQSCINQWYSTYLFTTVLPYIVQCNSSSHFSSRIVLYLTVCSGKRSKILRTSRYVLSNSFSL